MLTHPEIIALFDKAHAQYTGTSRGGLSAWHMMLCIQYRANLQIMLHKMDYSCATGLYLAALGLLLITNSIACFRLSTRLGSIRNRLGVTHPLSSSSRPRGRLWVNGGLHAASGGLLGGKAYIWRLAGSTFQGLVFLGRLLSSLSRTLPSALSWVWCNSISGKGFGSSL